MQEQLLKFRRRVERKGLLFAAPSRSNPEQVTPGLERLAGHSAVTYGLTRMLELGVREVAIAAPAGHRVRYARLLGDGNRYGIELSYLDIPAGGGLVATLAAHGKYFAGMPALVMEADKILTAADLAGTVLGADTRQRGALVFSAAAPPSTAELVASVNGMGRVVALPEEGAQAGSRHALTGLYLLDARASEFASWVPASLSGPAALRGLLGLYAGARALHCHDLGEASTWFDTSDQAQWEPAQSYLLGLEARLRMPLAAPELTAYRKGWTMRRQLAVAAKRHEGTAYGELLRAELAGPGANAKPRDSGSGLRLASG